MPLVYIILVNWNGWKDSIDCIESLKKIDYKNYKIIIVDNGSLDGSYEILKEKFPILTIIKSDENLGFAGGNNLGIEYALKEGADFVYLLNNDTIVDKDVVSELIKAADEYPVAGVFGSKIYYYSEPNRIWCIGGIIDFDLADAPQIGSMQIDNGQYEKIQEVGYVSGCSMLLRKEVIEEIGLMDDKFFLYWEETDWQFRIRQKGWQIIYVPKSKLWHKISASAGVNSKLSTYYMYRNAYYFFDKNSKGLLKLKTKIALLKRFINSLVYWLKTKNFENCRVLLLALYDGIFGNYGKKIFK